MCGVKVFVFFRLVSPFQSRTDFGSPGSGEVEVVGEYFFSSILGLFWVTVLLSCRWKGFHPVAMAVFNLMDLTWVLQVAWLELAVVVGAC